MNHANASKLTDCHALAFSRFQKYSNEDLLLISNEFELISQRQISSIPDGFCGGIQLFSTTECRPDKNSAKSTVLVERNGNVDVRSLQQMAYLNALQPKLLPVISFSSNSGTADVLLYTSSSGGQNSLN